MKAKFLIALLFLVFSISSFAEPAKKETVNELLEVMQAQKIMDSIYSQMDVMFKQMTQQMKIEESQKPVMEKFFVKYTALFKTEMSWEKFKDPMIDAYVKVYTEREVKDIIKFYKSPAGQKMLAKMPELMQASMGIAQNMMKDLIPKVTELQKELETELKESSTKK